MVHYSICDSGVLGHPFGHGRLSGHHSFGCPSAPASAAIPAVWHPSSPCCFASRCSSSGSVLSHFLWSHFGAASAFTSTIRDTIRVRSARICPPGSARPGGATTPRAWRGRVGTRDASMKCRGTCKASATVGQEDVPVQPDSSSSAMQQVFLVYVFDVRLCWHWLWCSWNGGSTAFAPAALEPRMSLCPIIRWKQCPVRILAFGRG